ncbi:MAG: Uma2 family endonuclease [Pseudomonadota bacterium]|nr:Uma2 family endonuclease [Pseudomonadota bacterium]
MSEARRVATYADLERVPDHLVGEIIAGELVVSPRPAGPHGLAESGLAGGLFPFNKRAEGPGGPGGWWILTEPELHLGGDVLIPDIAGWRRERLPQGPVDAAFTVAPDWVCEILSPRTASRDRIQKMDCYLRENVQHVWLVDPLERTLEVYRRHDGNWLRVGAFAGYTRVRAEPFEAEELDMSRWWLEPTEAPTEPGTTP